MFVVFIIKITSCEQLCRQISANEMNSVDDHSQDVTLMSVVLTNYTCV